MKFRTRSILIEPSIEGGIKVSFTTHDASFNSDIMHKYEGKDYEVTFKEYSLKSEACALRDEDKAREIGLRQAPTLVYGGKLYPEIAGVREFIDGLSK